MRGVINCKGRLGGMRSLVALALCGLFCLSAGAARAQEAAEPLGVSMPRSATSVKVGSGGSLPLRVEIRAGWHVFAAQPLVEGVKGFRVTFTAPPGITVFPVKLPASRRVKLAALGKEANVYEGGFSLPIQVRVAAGVAPGMRTLQGVLQYQACSDGACRLPKKVPIEIPVRIVK